MEADSEVDVSGFHFLALFFAPFWNFVVINKNRVSKKLSLLSLIRSETFLEKKIFFFDFDGCHKFLNLISMLHAPFENFTRIKFLFFHFKGFSEFSI